MTNIFLSEQRGIKTSAPDGRLDEWNNVEVPNLEIEWCEFTATLTGAGVQTSYDE